MHRCGRVMEAKWRVLYGAALVWLLLVAGSTTTFAQQNPCTSPVTDFAYRPTVLYVELPNFNATIPTATGTVAEFDEVEVGYFLSSPAAGAQPISTTKVARTALAAVPNAPNCYTAPLPSVPTQAQYGSARTNRTAVDPSTSTWGPVSNRFFTPAALIPPGATRLKP
jgi:hypothetical protein